MKKENMALALICLAIIVNFGSLEALKLEPQTGPRVLVIGAGIAGLASAKNLQDENINFTVLEATKYVGGTWRYDPRVGTDENGLPLFTSMYKHLRTNLPKQTMELEGFPIPQEMPSFPSWKLYYDYLNSYAEHFGLKKHIKFLHLVASVKRDGNIWKVKHKHVVEGTEYTEDYDFVFICTGHYSTPHYPKIPGENVFKGNITHSHDYRTPDPFVNRRVLVVGAGPSAMDIGLNVADVAKTLVHSQHSVVKFNTPFPANFIVKPDVREFNETGAVFTDGTFEELDDVLYCTGFEYNYPFLDSTSELTLTPKYVIPLYRYLVNIHQPSMVLLGLVVRCCVVASIDAQARYATALVKGKVNLPSKEDMMKEWQARADIVAQKKRPMSDIHLLAEKEDQYYDDLANESGTVRTPPVFFKIRVADAKDKLENLYTYRNYVYTVLDNDTFTRRYEEPKDYDKGGNIP